ncbi:DUF4276 family protein [Burkholderia contaminans]|uniref:DUF4276 family protein n=1 Tax=Burkholderia contaminans TaxID=488447 RepID=A0A6P2XPV5_9BURK|nr:DUF4276 family protein [Burkholderia contaminans]VWD10558.1 hypothetical protein BCO71033_02427 [Burkholderia contaminans]
MFIVIAEDETDYEAVEVFIRRISPKKVDVDGCGFEGCGDLINQGARVLNTLGKKGVHKFVIVHDCDGDTPDKRRELVINKIVKKVTANGSFCLLIPKEELEAWFFADISCVTKVWSGWRLEKNVDKKFPSPENVTNPKGLMKKMSVDQSMKPRFSTNKNKLLATHVDLEKIEKKCPSFLPLKQFVLEGKANYPDAQDKAA